MPGVTVGIPVYNGEKFVAEATALILTQNFRDSELIISDNGSTAGTERICRRYAACDSRVQYYRSPIKRGAAWNFNSVFELSIAPYFKWAAHDDICALEYLDRCVNALDRNHAVVLMYPKNRIIDGEGRLVGEHLDGFNLRSSRASDGRLQCLASTGRCNPVFGLIGANALGKTGLMGSYIASDYVLLAHLALIGEFWRWWRLMVEYCRSIARAPLDVRQRMRCYGIWIKWARWHWASLAGELHVTPEGRRAVEDF